MNDGLGSIEDWRWLAEGESRALLAAASPDVRAIESMRRLASPERARLAIMLTEARQRADGRIDRAPEILADPQGVQMATPSDVARWKAARFAPGPGVPILDLCSGVGGDSIALAQTPHTPTLRAIDLHPVRAYMSEHNARLSGGACEGVAASIDDIDTRGALVHIDPQRRSDGRRRLSLDAIEPSVERVARVLRRSLGGAVKLAPGLDPPEILGRFDPDQAMAAGVEYISRRGRMSQCVLWTGALHDGVRVRATMIGQGVHTLAGTDVNVPVALAPMARFLHEVDPAIERAGLQGELGSRLNLAMIHTRLGLYTSDAPSQDPWLTTFEVLERMGWRERKVREALRARHAGIVEVKTRGGAVDPDAAQRALRGVGERAYTVFVLRLGEKVEAIIARRAP